MGDTIVNGSIIAAMAIELGVGLELIPLVLAEMNPVILGLTIAYYSGRLIFVNREFLRDVWFSILRALRII